MPYVLMFLDAKTGESEEVINSECETREQAEMFLADRIANGHAFPGERVVPKTVFVVKFRGANMYAKRQSRPFGTRAAAVEFAADLSGMGIVGEIIEYDAALYPHVKV